MDTYTKWAVKINNCEGEYKSIIDEEISVKRDQENRFEKERERISEIEALHKEVVLLSDLRTLLKASMTDYLAESEGIIEEQKAEIQRLNDLLLTDPH